MIPAIPIRFTCDDCHIVFDLCVAPVAEWREQIGESDPPDVGEPGVCPFCGGGLLRPVDDKRAVVFTPW
jgi:hypothetical protein